MLWEFVSGLHESTGISATVTAIWSSNSRSLNLCSATPLQYTEFASDIAAVYPFSKRITLVHSRPLLLNRFDKFMHEKAYAKLKEMGVDVHLDSRVTMAKDEGKVVLRDGTEVEADLIVSVAAQTMSFHAGRLA